LHSNLILIALKRISLNSTSFYITLFFVVSIFWFACEKPSEIGLEIQPPGDKLNVVYCDTITLNTYSVLEDPILTNSTAYNLLGSYYDPIFGKNSASFYSQMRISSNAPTFGSNPVCDSLVLSLRYANYYGDTLTPQTVRVYRVAEDFYKDSSYYSNKELQITGELLGSKTFYPHPIDSIVVDSEKYPAHLRIPLDKSLGNIFLGLAGSSVLSDNTNFLDYFKGLYVTTTPVNGNGEGCIMAFNLLSSLSNVALYYKNDDNDTTSMKFYFVFNEYSARFNHYNHSNYLYADPYLRSEIYGDTTKGDSLLYLQGTAGLKVKIKYPYLNNLTNAGKIAINNAEMIIPVEENGLNTDKYNPPSKLILLEEKDGSIRYLLDQSNSYFGGTYDTTNLQYKFNISQHIQQVIDGVKENLGLSLMVYPTYRPNYPNRVVIKGCRRQSEKIRLIITYTKLY